MSTCRLIVCEKSSHWAAGLRVALAGQPPAIVETRSLAQAEAMLAESPASLIAVETTAANLEAVLELFWHASRQFHQALFAGLLAQECADAEPLLREAGAIDVLTTVLQAGRLARLARRQSALAPAVEPITMRQLVAERLPWSAYSNQN